MPKTLIAVVTLLFINSGFLYAGKVDDTRLASVLAAQPAEVQARYQYRHPQETLEFFGIAPGMTVVEALPGQGWYTKILLPYLGPEGLLIGADYSGAMYSLFGFFTEEQLAAKQTWAEDFATEAGAWAGADGAAVSGFVFGAMPEDLKGTADAVLLIRALHNLARFEGEGGYMTAALQNVYDVLKPGGIVGVVQHQARDNMSDEFADGSHGYLTRDFVIAQMVNAGFDLVAEMDFNQNEKDQPSESDVVWRLPPTYMTSRDNPELRPELEAVGESNRMTLKFRKPQ